MKYFCCTENRRRRVRDHATLNGLNFLEVIDLRQIPDGTWIAQLELHFLKPLPVTVLPEMIILSIQGGERITDFAFDASTIDVADRQRFTVDVIPMGDFSSYTLTVDEAGAVDLDPLLRSVEFSFTVECNTDFDCAVEQSCLPTVEATQPEIDYLAKDYASFRQVVLDRLSVLMPDWQTRNTADLNIVLVELLAYVGDYLSYQQDSVATEAYLNTARSRVSVQRHARLVDYFMHNGSNARAWVQVAVNNPIDIPAKTQLMTQTAGFATRIAPGDLTYDQILQQKPVVFETLQNALLYPNLNRIELYTWGEENCCLPKGATMATLLGRFSELKAGDVLIFVEIRGSQTGDSADADKARRHPIRLTHVTLSNDPLDNIDITEISWSTLDALPEPFCVKAVSASLDDSDLEEVTTIVFGNILLADQGSTVVEEIEDSVPHPHIELPQSSSFCDVAEPVPIPQRYRPALLNSPVTQATGIDQKDLFRNGFDTSWRVQLDSNTLPISLNAALRARGLTYDNDASVQGHSPQWSISDGQQAHLLIEDDTVLVVRAIDRAVSLLTKMVPTQTLPAIELRAVTSDGDDPGDWSPKRDLLSSDKRDRDFVVEVENDSQAYLRFGDDQFGLRPSPETKFTATYRVGNGSSGNVGSDTIAHIVSSDNAILSIRNPLPAWGGMEPETIANVRQQAPYAYRQQARAVTPEDYAMFAEKHPSVQRAMATLRWTGSWHTVFLTIDRLDGAPITASFENELRAFLEQFRLAGHDLEIDAPQYASLEIDMTICVKPDYFCSDVQQALQSQFTSGYRPNGSPGLLHPDNFTFGQTVYLSPLYAAAAAVEGVESVEITRFHRQGNADSQPLADGKLTVGRLEIPRLENNPSFPERGVLRLTCQGGK